MWKLLLICLAELVWSYCASQTTVWLVKRHLWRAMFYDFMSLFIAYEILAVLSRGDWSQVEILAAVCGGVVGTGFVAHKKSPEPINENPVNI